MRFFFFGNLQLTCSQRQWLHSSVGRASHRYREVTGSSPVEVLNFFRLLYAIVKIAITTARIILHLISYPQFTYDLFDMHHSLTYLSREHMNPQLTCSQCQWLHSSVGRVSHRYCEVTGSSPIEVLNFFRLLYAIVKIAITTARIILHLISYPQFTYDLFDMHHSLTCLSQEHMNPQLTCSQRQWLHSPIGRASHWYREVTGSSPVEVLNFFRRLYAIVEIAITTARIILHLISYLQFTYDLFDMHHSLTYLSREHMNPQLTCSQRQWLHSSVGRVSHRYREVTGSSPVEVLNFFRLLYTIVKIAITTARIILHLISYPQFTYDLFHICIIQSSVTLTRL